MIGYAMNNQEGSGAKGAVSREGWSAKDARPMTSQTSLPKSVAPTLPQSKELKSMTASLNDPNVPGDVTRSGIKLTPRAAQTLLRLQTEANAAEKRRDAALRQIRQKDAASIEAFKTAEADYRAAHKKFTYYFLKERT